MAFKFSNVFTSLKKNTASRPKKALGIDFGASSVKVVELELRDDVIALSTYGELQLGPYAQESMGNAVSLSLEKKTEALVDVMRESGVTSKDGILALPLSDSFVTIISLSAKEGEDISSRVHVEARKYIPVPISDVALEWTEITPEGKLPVTVREVLLAAIQNDALSDMKSLLTSVQMVSQPFEIELFSTLRAVSKETDASVAVIDIGAKTSKLYISENGYLQRIHRVQAGGAHATAALAKALSLTFEEAENAKRNYSPEKEHAGEIKKIMASYFDRSFEEFKRVLNQYEEKVGAPVSRIVLSGGCTQFYDFLPYTQYAFDREVEKTHPFAKVAYPAFMEDTLKEIGPVFAVALGAALRPFEQ